MNVDIEKIQKIFDYLFTETSELKPADCAFVFCRDNPILAKRAAKLYLDGLVKYIMFTGGMGKDSGYLAALGCPEAVFQAAAAHLIHGIPTADIYVEPKARDGVENSQLGIETIVKNSLPHQNLIIVCHPTQIRRLHGVHLIEAAKKHFSADYQLAGSGYKFKPQDIIDQKEAVHELLKVADWSALGKCAPQDDLPDNLVDFARQLQSEWNK